MRPDFEESLRIVEESRRNFIKTRMEKFGETEEQAHQLYERLVFQMAVKVMPRAMAMLKAALK